MKGKKLPVANMARKHKQQYRQALRKCLHFFHSYDHISDKKQLQEGLIYISSWYEHIIGYNIERISAFTAQMYA